MSNGIRCEEPTHTRGKRNECTDCSRATKRKYREANIQHYRAYARKYWRRNLGLPSPTRPEPKVCEACGRPNKNDRAMALDHDHLTGEFRGWLCYRCNAGIGMLGDNIAGLEKAIAYLKQNQSIGM